MKASKQFEYKFNGQIVSTTLEHDENTFDVYVGEETVRFIKRGDMFIYQTNPNLVGAATINSIVIAVQSRLYDVYGDRLIRQCRDELCFSPIINNKKSLQYIFEANYAEASDMTVTDLNNNVIYTGLYSLINNRGNCEVSLNIAGLKIAEGVKGRTEAGNLITEYSLFRVLLLRSTLIQQDVIGDTAS